MKRLSVLLAAVWLAAAAPAANFLTTGAIDVGALLPAPPAADSLVTRAELEVVLQLQAGRTPVQAARCKLVENEDIFFFGSDVLGEWFNAANLPQTAAFFAKVHDDFLPINHAAKAIWPRRRPSFVDARVLPCVEVADSGAYPSGHGIQSALWAALLSEIFPAQAAGFQQRAQETRQFKLLSGVHYPSDLEAGRMVGEAIARELLKNPTVQKSLDEIRAEAAPHQLH